MNVFPLHKHWNINGCPINTKNKKEVNYEQNLFVFSYYQKQKYFKQQNNKKKNELRIKNYEFVTEKIQFNNFN